MLSKFVTLGDKLELETVERHEEEQELAVKARKTYKSQVHGAGQGDTASGGRRI